MAETERQRSQLSQMCRNKQIMKNLMYPERQTQ